MQVEVLGRHICAHCVLDGTVYSLQESGRRLQHRHARTLIGSQHLQALRVAIDVPWWSQTASAGSLGKFL